MGSIAAVILGQCHPDSVVGGASQQIRDQDAKVHVLLRMVQEMTVRGSQHGYVPSRVGDNGIEGCQRSECTTRLHVDPTKETGQQQNQCALKHVIQWVHGDCGHGGGAIRAVMKLVNGLVHVWIRMHPAMRQKKLDIANDEVKADCMRNHKASDT